MIYDVDVHEYFYLLDDFNGSNLRYTLDCVWDLHVKWSCGGRQKFNNNIMMILIVVVGERLVVVHTRM